MWMCPEEDYSTVVETLAIHDIIDDNKFGFRELKKPKIVMDDM